MSGRANGEGALTTIQLRETPRLTYALRLADSMLVLSHRLSEWCGHAPMLEEDLALANIALDLLGQARLLYDHAAALEGAGRTEDDLAYLRDAPQFRNLLIAELPRGDFAFIAGEATDAHQVAQEIDAGSLILGGKCGHGIFVG